VTAAERTAGGTPASAELPVDLGIPRGVDGLLLRARSRLTRVTPDEAAAEVRAGAVLVDTRPEFQRRTDGEIPGALVIERNHLEWRLDPASEGRVPAATGTGVRWIVLCDAGYASSLAAAALQVIGLHRATDLAGGFQAWRAAGLPVVRPEQPTPPLLAPVH
jgi:rhodanese-related sulfurtransferase